MCWAGGMVSSERYSGIDRSVDRLEVLHDTPESMGFPSVNVPKQKKEMSETETADFNKAQRQVLLMPAIWILLFQCFYVYQPLCSQ